MGYDVGGSGSLGVRLSFSSGGLHRVSTDDILESPSLWENLSSFIHKPWWATRMPLHPDLVLPHQQHLPRAALTLKWKAVSNPGYVVYSTHSSDLFPKEKSPFNIFHIITICTNHIPQDHSAPGRHTRSLNFGHASLDQSPLLIRPTMKHISAWGTRMLGLALFLFFVYFPFWRPCTRCDVIHFNTCFERYLVRYCKSSALHPFKFLSLCFWFTGPVSRGQAKLHCN